MHDHAVSVLRLSRRKQSLLVLLKKGSSFAIAMSVEARKALSFPSAPRIHQGAFGENLATVHPSPLICEIYDLTFSLQAHPV